MIKKNNLNFFHYVYTIFFGYLFLLVAFCFLKINHLQNNAPKPINYLPDFNFYNHHGDLITKDSLINKITILDFIFTRCQGTCPIMSDYMKEMYKNYKGNPKVILISVTIDPDHDTKDILNLYAQANEIDDNGWYFLTGDMEKIKGFGKNAFSLVSDFFPSTHTKNFYLIDNSGRYRKFYDGTNKKSIKSLKNHVDLLLSEIEA